MILTDFALRTDRGDTISAYVEPLAGMMVRDPDTGEDWVISAVNKSLQIMTLLRDGARRDGVSYSKQTFRLVPGRNGEFEWAGVYDPPVVLTSRRVDTPGDDKWRPGHATEVRIHIRRDATEEDVRRALHQQYPAAIESTIQTWREMSTKPPMRYRIES